MTDPTPRSIADVLPQAAAALGVHQVADRWLRDAGKVVVVLIDGLGLLNLEQAPIDSPLVETLLAEPAGATSLPSTTPVALASFGTGSLPGEHGFVGATFLVPELDVLLQPLHWQAQPSPLAVQPEPTWFEMVAARGVPATRIGPAAYADSGLTQAVLRGGEHLPAETLSELVAAAVAVPAGLVYAYYPKLDKLGHVHGVASDEWRAELAEVLAALAELRRGLPGNVELLVTADHGMVDITQRMWIEDRPGLLRNLRAIAGEPRLRHCFAEPGAGSALLRDWQAVADVADVYSREEFIATGWLGTVADFAADRIGDVVAVAKGTAAIGSRKFDARVSALKGLHGSTSDLECVIPIARLAG